MTYAATHCNALQHTATDSEHRLVCAAATHAATHAGPVVGVPFAHGMGEGGGVDWSGVTVQVGWWLLWVCV